MQDNNIFENENEFNQTEPKIEEKAAENENFVNSTPVYSYVPPIPAGFTEKTYKEKKEIKKTANTVGAMLLSFFGFILFYNLFVMALNFAFSSSKNFYNIYSDPAVTQVIQIVLSSSLFTLPFIFIAKITRNRISSLINTKPPEKGKFLPLFFFGAAFCSFANIAISYAGQIFENFGINYDVDYGENPEGFFGFILCLLSTVAVPALAEEFAFRGVIMGLLRRFGEGFAVMVSAILFGVIHGNFEQMPFAFLVGLGLGFVAIKSGSIWTAVAIHAYNNFVSLIFNYFLSDISVFLQNIIYTFLLIITLMLGIVMLIVLRNDNSVYKFQKSETECSEKQKYKWFFLTPTIIIFIIIFVIESFAFFV